MAPMVIPSAQTPAIEATASDPRIETALHAFFKTLGEQSPYAVMLGGSMAASGLNQTVFIGLNPRQTIQVHDKTLSHTFFDKGTKPATLSLNTTEQLFSYLRGQSWTEQAFLFSSYEFYKYCDPGLTSLEDAKLSTEDDLLLVDFQDIGQFDLNTLTWKWYSQSTGLVPEYQLLWESILSAGQVPGLTKAGNQRTAASSDIDLYSQEFSTSFSKPDFEKAVSAILGHIQAGDRLLGSCFGGFA